MGICICVEALLIEPLLDTSVSQQRLGWPCQKVGFEKLEVLAAEEDELWIHCCGMEATGQANDDFALSTT